MNKKFVKALAALTVGSVLATNVSYAQGQPVKKNETIYVTQENGKIIDKTASVWLNSEENIKVKDKSNLKEIKNLETDEKIKTEGGYINWDQEDKDIYYQGKSNEELPVDVNIKYFLDGKEISAKDLEGKSGQLKITVDTVNKKYEEAKINGKDTNIYSPYAVLTAMTFDSEKVTNIKSDDGKIVKDGKNEIVTGLLTPGLKENLKDILDEDKLEKFKDHMEIEMDVKDYKVAEMYTIITNEFFQEDANINSLDDLNNGIDQLEDNIVKLVDGSDQLFEASQKLNDGIGKVSDGANSLAEGTSKLDSSFGQLQNGFKDLPEKVKPIAGAVNELNQGGASLNKGITDYTKAVGQINENMPALNQGASALEEGAGKLDDGLGELKKGTASLREKTYMLASSGDEKDKMTSSLGELQSGVNQLGENIKPLATGLGELNKGLGQISQSSKSLNQGIAGLNQQAKNTPNMAASIANINEKAQIIEGVIANLEANNVDGINNDAIASLSAAKDSLYQESYNLGQNAEVYTGISAGLGQLEEGSSKLNAAIDQANAGSKEITEKIGQSEEELEKASQGLSQGIEQINQGFSESNIQKLVEAIAMLDDAAGELKAGSTKLKEGTSQNKAGVAKLTGALGELDQNSASLKDGSAKLSGGLSQFEEKSKGLSKLSNINDQALNPMAEGIRTLNTGALQLRDGANELKNGSDSYQSAFDKFRQGLRDYKVKGIDELENKTKDVSDISDILEEMSKLAKENNSISGTSEDFETRSRIIEKIK